MQVRVTKSFRWSPDGIEIVEIEVGAIVEGRAAEVALQSFEGEPVDDEQELEQEPDQREPAIEAAPEEVAEQPAARKGRRKN